MFKILFHALLLQRLFILNIDLHCVLNIILKKKLEVLHKLIISNTVKKFKISSQTTFSKSVTINFDTVTLFVSKKN